MPPYPYLNDGTPLRAPATGFPCFIGAKRLKRVITSDIWAFLAHQTERELDGKDEQLALAYLEQARDFYHAVEGSRAASRPLLYYYAYLNIAKVLLLHRGIALPPKIMHGIFDPAVNVKKRFHFKGQKVKIAKKGGGGPPQEGLLFPTLLLELDPGKAGLLDTELNVLDLMGHLPAIHRTYSTVTDKAEHFVPVESFSILRKDYHLWLRATVRKGAATDAQIRRLCEVASFTNVFSRASAQTIPDEPDLNKQYYYFQTQPQPYGPRYLDKAIGDLAETVRTAGVWAVATDGGYRYYFSTMKDASRLPQLAASLAVMFYFGSITRYKPLDYDKITEKYAWLMNDFLTTDPAQVLYLLASQLSEREVVKPFAIQR